MKKYLFLCTLFATSLNICLPEGWYHYNGFTLFYNASSRYKGPHSLTFADPKNNNYGYFIEKVIPKGNTAVVKTTNSTNEKFTFEAKFNSKKNRIEVTMIKEEIFKNSLANSTIDQTPI